MTTAAQAIGKAAVVRAHLTGVERRLQDGIDIALDAGRQDIADRLGDALTLVEAGHAAATEAAGMIAAHFGEGVEAFSGPEDKPDPDPAP